MVAGVVLPVLVPFRRIVAPVGAEFTVIFPTAETTDGSSSRSNNAQITRKFFFMSDFPIVQTNKNTWVSSSDKFY